MPDASRTRAAADKTRVSAARPVTPRAGDAQRPALSRVGNRAMQRLVADPEAPRAAAAAALGAGNSAIQRLVSPGDQNGGGRQSGNPAPVQRQLTPEEQRTADEKRRNEAIVAGQMAPPGRDPRLDAEARTGRIADAEAQRRATANANIDRYEAEEVRRKQREDWLKSLGVKGVWRTRLSPQPSRSSTVGPVSTR